MFDGTSLGNGNHRLTFGPDGSLWVGKTHLSWAGAEGLKRIRGNGLGSIFTVKSVKLEKAGDRQALRIAFSQPVTDGLEGVKMNRFSYKYQEEYGSPKIEEAEVVLDPPVLSADGREVLLGFDAKQGSIHHLVLSSLKNGGESLEGAELYYQASELP
jgi:hypothetical protein